MERAGVTLIEFLVVLVIIGVLAGLAFFAWPDEAGRTAREMGRLFQQARFEAVKRESATAVVWNAAARTLEVRSDVESCADAGVLVRTLNVSQRRVSQIDVNLAGGGLIWLPSNFARDCDNAAFGGTDAATNVRVHGRSGVFTVDITAGGLVTVQ